MGKRIKLAILDADQNYLQRIVSVFSVKYADKLEIYSFTDKKVALASLKMSQVDVFVVSDRFEVEQQLVPKNCAFAYLVDVPGVDTVRDATAIFKFQKADLLYKQVLSLYSEQAGYMTSLIGEGLSSTIAFVSAGGGVGSSSMAAACALNFTQRGLNTLYLNLEKLGSADRFFTGEGSLNFSDVIFALKSKKAGLSLKLESCVKQDRHKVFFYSEAKTALDMTELSFEETKELLTIIKQSGTYSSIIIDLDFSIEKDYLNFYNSFDHIVMVSDGSDICNEKTMRAIQAITMLEQYSDLRLTGKMSIVYNKFSNKHCKLISDLDMRELGGAPRFESTDINRIIEQIATLDIFNKL